MRQIVLDTETTGLDPSQGHKIIEIGCVELVNRKLTGNHYHQYINPQRDIEAEAMEVHGITNEFLADKPIFHQIADEFMAFVDGEQLVIYNAPFDIGFLDAELRALKQQRPMMADRCTILDSLVMARQKHPGQRNSLDALCKRYGVDNYQRDLHGALLDSEILADVYLLMTGGQTALSLGAESSSEGNESGTGQVQKLKRSGIALPVIEPCVEELALHDSKLQAIDKASGGNCIFLKP